MQEFRRFTEGTLGKVILVMMILPFVIAGFYGYFASGGNADQVATVGDQSITKTALTNKVRSTRQRLRQSNPNLSPDMLRRFVSPSMVLDSMINDALLEQAAVNADMLVSAQQISQEIVAVPNFQGADGNFSHDVFVQQVNRMGYTPSGFIAALQQQAVRAQLQSAYSLTNFALPKEVSEQQQLVGQTRSITYTKVSLAATAAAITLSAKDAQAYYKAHLNDYRRPPQLRIKWIEIKPDEYNITVSDKQIKQEYAARKLVLEKTVSQNQERQIADIFIAVNDKRDATQAAALAAKLHAKLKGGANFGDLAKKHSDDALSSSQGGNLGWLMQQALPANLGKVAFALQKGAVSEPVKADRGYHLVKVEGIKSQGIPSLNEMRADIVKDIKQQNLLAKVSTDSSRLSDLAYEHSDLSIPAEKLGLQLHTSDWFSIDKPTGFAANPQITAALNDHGVMSEERNSDLINLGNNQYAVIHVAAKRKATQLSYDEVADRVMQQAKVAKATQRLAALQKAAVKATSLKQVAASWDSSLTSLDAIKRRDSRLKPGIVTQVFKLPAGTQTKPQLLHDNRGDLWAITVTSVTAGQAPSSEKAQQLAIARAGAAQGKQSFNAYLDWLRSSEEIKVNQSKLSGLR